MDKNSLLEIFKEALGLSENKEEIKEEDNQSVEEEVKGTPAISDEEKQNLKSLSDEELNRILDTLDEKAKNREMERSKTEKMSAEEKRIYDLERREQEIEQKTFELELKAACASTGISQDIANNFLNVARYKDIKDRAEAIKRDLQLLRDFADTEANTKIQKISDEKDAKYLELSRKLSEQKTAGKVPFKGEKGLSKKPKNSLELIKEMLN